MKKGEFESCFADGLDLSEFTNNNSTNTNNNNSESFVSNQQQPLLLSHSAILLQTKQLENTIKLDIEKEDIQVQGIIQDRVEQIEKVIIKDNDKNNIIRAYRPEQQQLTPSSISGKQSGVLEFVHQPNTNSNSKRLQSNIVNSTYDTTTTISGSLISSVVVGMHETYRNDDMPRRMIRNNKHMNKIAKKKSIRRKY